MYPKFIFMDFDVKQEKKVYLNFFFYSWSLIIIIVLFLNLMQ